MARLSTCSNLCPKLGLSQPLQDSGVLYSAVQACQIKSGAPLIIARIGSGPSGKQDHGGICIAPTANHMQGRVLIIISAVDICAVIYLCLEGASGSGFQKFRVA